MADKPSGGSEKDSDQVRAFNLSARDWRRGRATAHAIASSLCIHHLQRQAKRQLYADLFGLLQPGATLLIADIIQPATARATSVAAQQWDDLVRTQTAAQGMSRHFEQFVAVQWNIFRYPDPTDRPALLWDQLQWLEAAGSTNVDVHWMHAGHALFGGEKRSSEDE